MARKQIWHQWLVLWKRVNILESEKSNARDDLWFRTEFLHWLGLLLELASWQKWHIWESRICKQISLVRLWKRSEKRDKEMQSWVYYNVAINLSQVARCMERESTWRSHIWNHPIQYFFIRKIDHLPHFSDPRIVIESCYSLTLNALCHIHDGGIGFKPRLAVKSIIKLWKLKKRGHLCCWIDFSEKEWEALKKITWLRELPKY